MKQLFFSFVLLLTAIGYISTASAQNCDGVRYYAPTFSSYDTSTVVYATDGSTMDIYQPDGDTTTGRKAVLLIHGGNFYQGSSIDPFIYHMCQLFVKNGYVVSSINYPLISNVQILTGVLEDSSTAYPIIAQTIADGKAAVRYLKKNASALGIDSTWIVIGGESSGGLIADHVAYLKSNAGVSPLLDSCFNAIGGIEGNSGNPGYASTVKAVLNYGGGMLSLNMLTPLDNEPIYTAQGDSDHNIPFGCGYLFDGYTDYTACGGGAMQPVLTVLGIKNQLLAFDSLDYEPWLDSTMAQTGDTNHLVIYQVDSQSILFLYQLDCPTFTGLRDIGEAHVNLYPDPASTLVYIQTDAAMESVEIIDRLGRLIKTLPAKGEKVQIPLEGLTSGLYLAKINLKDSQSTITRSFVVE